MNYSKPSAEMIEALQALLPGRVYTGDDINDDYTHDEMAYNGKYYPDLAVEVLTTQEVSEVCRLCYENNVPIVPRGAGTGLSGGCVPVAGGVIIDMSKMNQILSVDLDRMVIRVQAGALVEDVQKACDEIDMMYAPDPGEKLATVGGNVATNAGGMRACKYGTTRDHVRAMTVVMPNGDIMRMGAEVSKNCTGYSLMNLMSGSEGTLGIITELSMRIIAKPKVMISLLAPFEDLESCISCVSKIKAAGLDPQALEFMMRDNVADVEEFLGKKIYPDKIDGVDCGAYLLVTFDGPNEDILDETLETAADLFMENGALDVLIYDTADGFRNVWAVRGNVLEALLANFKQQEETDVVVPIPNIAEFVAYAVSLEDELEFKVRATGHAGDGNVHINVCANDMDEDKFVNNVAIFMDKVYEKGIELGGLISGEHGIGSAKMKYLARNLGEEQVALMKAIKQACDPKMLLNPGKVCFFIQ